LIAPRYSTAFRIVSDVLFVLFACFAATLLSLVVQRDMVKQNLRESSLDRAAQYIARQLQIEPTGKARLLPPSGTSSPSADYSAMVFDRNGRLLFERPEGLNRTLSAGWCASGRATRSGSSRFSWTKTRPTL
jgi:hypothetical protein